MTPLALLSAALLAAPAHALDGNDQLTLELVDGRTVEGWYHGYDDGVVRLSAPEGFVAVPVATVSAVRRDGELLPMADFQVELGEAQARLDALRTVPVPTPHPALAAGASLGWAGAGQAMLGDWRGFAAYSAVEGVLLGTAAWSLSQGNGGMLLPLVGLDLLFKGWSAGEAARDARRRRRQRDNGRSD